MCCFHKDRLSVFEDGVMRIILGLKRDEIRGDRRKSHNELKEVCEHRIMSLITSTFRQI
jgi:hypothetical protein